MKCSLCAKEIRRSFSFNNLFTLDYVCDECSKILDFKEVIIPISCGFRIRYYYATESNNYFPYKKVIIPLLKLLKENRNKTFLFADLKTLPILDNLILNDDIILFSYRYLELENYIIFEENVI